MGKLLEFPKKNSEKMPAHAVDLRRVIQEIRRLIGIYGSDTDEMWRTFNIHMEHLISGYTRFEVDPDEAGGKVVTIYTDCVVGYCSFSVLVYNELLTVKK
jgi:hypothetical protein